MIFRSFREAKAKRKRSKELLLNNDFPLEDCDREYERLISNVTDSAIKNV